MEERWSRSSVYVRCDSQLQSCLFGVKMKVKMKMKMKIGEGFRSNWRKRQE